MKLHVCCKKLLFIDFSLSKLIIIIMCFVIFSYQACYDYTINNNNECELMNQDVMDLHSFTYGNGTVYEVNTPVLLPSLVYPNNKICFFEIGKRYI